MLSHNFAPWAVAACCLTILGCSDETVISSAIRTQGIHAEFQALAQGNGLTTVSAELRVGGDDGTVVQLQSPDELIASSGSASRQLTWSDGQYVGQLDVEAGGSEISVAFNRGPNDSGAPDSRVTLPAPFSLTLDEQETTIARGQSVQVAWDAGSGQVRWSIDGDCLFRRRGETPDDGSLTISAADIRVAFRGDTCRAVIRVERESTGQVDLAFAQGGSFSAVQRREIAFTSTPAPDEPGGQVTPPPQTPDAGDTDAPPASNVIDAGTANGPSEATSDAGAADAGATN